MITGQLALYMRSACDSHAERFQVIVFMKNMQRIMCIN
jgi:hypothetical protein